MDIKITSITEAIMRTALDQARDGRIHILGEMAQGISTARDALSQMAPRITVIHINKDKIREVIGPGGKVIRENLRSNGCPRRSRGRRHGKDRGGRPATQRMPRSSGSVRLPPNRRSA